MHMVTAYLMHMPIELFTLIASFLEELISPIPSFLAYVPAGAALQIQGGSVWYILVLAVIGGLGHIFGSIIVYALANKFRDYLFTKRASWLGVSKKDVTAFRAKVNGKWSGWALFMMWALPIFPGAPLSILCGFVKIPMHTFIVATFFGSIINALCYLYIGYFGLKTLAALKLLELTGQIIVLLLVVALIVWLVQRRRKKTMAK